MSPQDLAALTKAVDAPLSPSDQAALEAKHTDARRLLLLARFNYLH